MRGHLLKNFSIFSVLLSAVGPVDKSLEILKKIHLSPQAKRELDHLKSVVSELKNRAPEISLTVDPVEIRGYEYHSYLTFTIFSKGIRGELGRGVDTSRQIVPVLTLEKWQLG